LKKLETSGLILIDNLKHIERVKNSFNYFFENKIIVLIFERNILKLLIDISLLISKEIPKIHQCENVDSKSSSIQGFNTEMSSFKYAPIKLLIRNAVFLRTNTLLHTIVIIYHYRYLLFFQ